MGAVVPPHAVVPSGTQMQGASGKRPLAPQCVPAAHCPLQYGNRASPQGWLPSGAQPQKGGTSAMNWQTNPVGQEPPQLPGPPPHGIVVVVVGGTHPPAPHASQQLVYAPTHALPPRGATHLAALERMAQLVSPFGDVRQHVTTPGRPHVERAAQRWTAFLHVGRSASCSTRARATPSAHRTYCACVLPASQAQVLATTSRAAASSAGSVGRSPQVACAAPFTSKSAATMASIPERETTCDPLPRTAAADASHTPAGRELTRKNEDTRTAP